MTIPNDISPSNLDVARKSKNAPRKIPAECMDEEVIINVEAEEVVLGDAVSVFKSTTLLEAHEGLGTFILAQANGNFDPRVQERLAGSLKERFDRLSRRYVQALREGAPIADADDDWSVFSRLMTIGRDALQPTRFRRVGPWELQFNPLRFLRLGRIAATRVTGLSKPFDPDGFHFNKPFLRKEAFWSGEIDGTPVDLLYNKFPFAPLHCVWAPDREASMPQYLTEDRHHHVWAVTEAMGEGMPGVGFGYNAFGAFSSVNHLHFQLFVRERPLPVQEARWGHNGGDTAYPTTVLRHEDPHEAWDCIQDLHAESTTYNLLYFPGHLFICPRRYQGGYAHSNWTRGYSWYELGGGTTIFNRADFERLGAADMAAELARLKP